ncbi:hypothetical protein R5E07_003926 [Vibrio vulnificus]|nr:hypothetical protein [Vibrio vulnificus]ELS9097766.1 hypothetical protein [Vibrio vulnificus]
MKIILGTNQIRDKQTFKVGSICPVIETKWCYDHLKAQFVIRSGDKQSDVNYKSVICVITDDEADLMMMKAINIKLISAGKKPIKIHKDITN